MARAIWSGVMSFGLVSIPVALYSATESHSPDFHQFQEGTKDRIRYQRVNERTGKEVDYADIVKGAQTSKGTYVTLDDEELASVAPGRSRSMTIERFVELDDIDPLFFDKSYFLGPGGDENKKTYALLRDAMAKSGRAAIARYVMRDKEYLAAVRADGDALVLETLFFADEVRTAKDEIDDLPGKLKLTADELKMAEQLIDSMTGSWDPSDYEDTYTKRVKALINAKSKNKSVRTEDEAPEATGATDLMEALRASVESSRGSGRKGSAKKSAAKKGPARKRTATKTTKKAAGKAAGKKTARKKPAKKSTRAA